MVKPKLTPPPLRDYQIEAVQEVLKAWSSFKRVCVQSPTGSGKSLIIAALILDFACRGEPILLVAHKVELIRQLQDHVKHWTGLEAGIIANKSVFKPNPSALIQVASIQALARKRPHNLPSASLVVIDEAHHSSAPSYGRLFSHYESSYILGVTATPTRLDGKGLRFLHNGIGGFEVLVKGMGVRELIERGYLAEYRVYQSQTILDPRSAGVHSRCGDYVQQELETLALNNLTPEEIVDTYVEVAPNKRAIVYPVSVELSQIYAQSFNERGIAAAHLDCFTSAKKRKRIIDSFRSGEILILCQHSIVIEGLDLPSIECVIIARPTKSMTFWFQAIGRALRPAEGKEYATIIDCTTNVLELPWIDEEIEWSLDAVSLKKKNQGSFQCQHCRHIWRLNQGEKKQCWTICPSCGKVYELLIDEQNRQDKSKQKEKDLIKGIELFMPEGITTVEDITAYIQQRRLQQELEEQQRQQQELERQQRLQQELEEQQRQQQELERQQRQAKKEFTRGSSLFDLFDVESSTPEIPISLYPPDEFSEKLIWIKQGMELIEEWLSGEEKLEPWQEELILVLQVEGLLLCAEDEGLSGEQRVDALVKVQQLKDYRKGWVQYRMLDLEGLCLEDFYYAAHLLGYRAGWAKYKWLEYNDGYGEDG